MENLKQKDVAECATDSDVVESGLSELIGKDIIVYGLGNLGQEVIPYLKAQGNIRILGASSSSVVEDTTRDFDGEELQIRSLGRWKECAPEASVLLAIPKRFHAEIKEACRQVGFNDVLKPQAEILCHARDEFFRKHYCNNPIEEKKVIFHNMGTYSGHGKYITEQLLKSRKDLDIVWAVKDVHVKVPEGVRLVDQSARDEYFSEMATAKVWVIDYRLHRALWKRPEQVCINVKHWSSITLKTFGTDLRYDRELTVERSALVDYFIVGSDFDAETCQRAFEFRGKFLKFGSPRSDLLFREQGCKRSIFRTYGLDESKKLLLYAPTFRVKNSEQYQETGNVDLDFEKTKSYLDRAFGGDWYILLRLHPNVADESEAIEKPPYVIDVSRYDDSQELVAACDAMVTDYSSIMFEPAFVRKPVFLFATDLEDYLENERDLLIDYRSLPFPVACNHDELEQNIRHFDYETYVQSVDSFLEHYGVHEDGHASERAAEFISNLISK